MALEDFKKTNLSKRDLKIGLKVIKEFKECESWEEWLHIPFLAWDALEKLEGYLEEMV